jgi:hypothetical protein
VADAAPGIAILARDQLGDGALSVSDDPRRDSLGARDDLAVDYQDPVVAAFAVLLDDDPIGKLPRVVPCFA